MEVMMTEVRNGVSGEVKTDSLSKQPVEVLLEMYGSAKKAEGYAHGTGNTTKIATSREQARLCASALLLKVQRLK